MAKFNQFKLELPLEAQMPMIHFQSGQCGATLRASEVKPKLDAYLLRKIGKEAGKSVTELKRDERYKGLFLDTASDINDALDYKLQITVNEQVREVKLGKLDKNDSLPKEEIYSLYYGNMGKNNPAEMIFGVFSNPTVTVICFKEKLRKYIEDSIEKFFLVTNFGTMQNKGFGSFAPKHWCPTGAKAELDADRMEAVAKAYGELIPNGKCYAMTFQNMPGKNAQFSEKNKFCVKMSEGIKTFYSIMKSGQNLGEKGYARSYIYEYAHDVLGLGNEKAWMKKNEIAPIVCKPENKKKHEFGSEEYRFLRAFLGIGEKIEYGTGYNENGFLSKSPAVMVNIESVDKQFERLASPIYFKVIRNVVFIVAFEIPEELYGAEFRFTGKLIEHKKDKGTVTGSGTIKVPTKAELKGNSFDIQDFLASYVDYYNGDGLRNKIPRLKNAPAVKEVKIDA